MVYDMTTLFISFSFIAGKGLYLEYAKFCQGGGKKNNSHMGFLYPSPYSPLPK